MQMKTYLLSGIIALFLCSLISGSFAQTTPIVIDSKSSAFTVADISNKNIDAIANILTYEIDLDNNHVADLIFSATMSPGTDTIKEYTSLRSQDSCTFSINPNGIGYQISSSKDTLIQKVTIVSIYNPNDILFADSCTTSQTTCFSKSWRSSEFPTEAYSREWISGPHYVGIKKIINNKEYLGWVKLFVTQYSKIRFNEYAIQTLPSKISEEEKSPVTIYPNPVTNQLCISPALGSKIEIFNAIGMLVFTEENKDPSPIFSIYLQDLNPGVYFIKIFETNKNRYVVKPFIKQ